jgi:hypothetical protein
MMLSIAANARRPLRSLGIESPTDAVDGSRDDLLRMLAWIDSGPDAVIEASARRSLRTVSPPL